MGKRLCQYGIRLKEEERAILKKLIIEGTVKLIESKWGWSSEHFPISLGQIRSVIIYIEERRPYIPSPGMDIIEWYLVQKIEETNEIDDDNKEKYVALLNYVRRIIEMSEYYGMVDWYGRDKEDRQSGRL